MRLGQVPDLVESLRHGVHFFANHAREAHTDRIAGGLLDNLNHIGLDADDVVGLYRRPPERAVVLRCDKITRCGHLTAHSRCCCSSVGGPKL